MAADRAFGGVYRGKRVLLTGHTGFKGSWLTAWLLRLGAEVTGFSRDVPTDPSLFEEAALAGRIDHRIGDVRDRAALAAVVAEVRPDIVLHLAAQAIVSRSYADPLETLATNVMGTANLLDVLRTVDWPVVGVFVTSDKCYENVEWPWGYRETDALGGRDVYSASKAGAEVAFHAYQQSFFKGADGPLIATARAGNVIGGGDWSADRIVVDCVRAWQRGERVQIRSPRSTRPWQHVLEPLSGYLLLGQALLEGREHGESFNFGPRAEQNRTVVELLSAIGERWGGAAAEQPYDVVANVPFHEAGLLKLSCDKALFRLKWEPNLTYDECVAFTGDWYRQVVMEGADAARLTDDQISAYEALARTRGRIWAG